MKLNIYEVTKNHDVYFVGDTLQLTAEIGMKKMKMGLVRLVKEYDTDYIDVRRNREGKVEFYNRYTTEAVASVGKDGINSDKVADSILGDQIEVNAKIDELALGLKALTEPPSFTIFNLANSSTVEIGYTIENFEVEWEIENHESAKLIQAYDATTNTILGSMPISATGSASVPVRITETVTGKPHQFQLKMLDGNDNYVDSEAKQIGWYFKAYVGSFAETTIDETAIKALSIQALKGGKTGTYNVPAGSGYKYVCYPKMYGLATSFKDASDTVIEMELPIETTITNTYGVSLELYVYRTTAQTSEAITIKVA